jgi:hypothetical protein
LSYGTPDEVRARCKEVLDGVARDGGYILDASAIIQNDARVENIRAMTGFTREYGVYSAGSSAPPPGAFDACHEAATGDNPPQDVSNPRRSRIKPGVCIPWDEKMKELPAIPGDVEVVRRIWEDIDALGNLYIWHCLVSF